LNGYIEQHWSTTRTEFAPIKAQFPKEAITSPEAFVSYCNELNTKNSKYPPWKTLQGLLWRQLYEEGNVKAPLYDDVIPALKALKSANIGIYIYSSGSIEAQKLIFTHTNHGDITNLIDGCAPDLVSCTDA
jgi:enolase-phosphatase E1